MTEPQLEAITEAYAATRYGGIIPNEAEVAILRQHGPNWNRKHGRSASTAPRAY